MATCVTAEATLAAPFDGVILTRMKLRQAARQSTDPKEKAAIEAALADPDFSVETTNQGLAAIGVPQASGPLPPGTLSKLLQWLLANLPQIIALILTLFGGG